MGTAVLLQLGLLLTGPLVARMLGVEDRGHLAALTLWPTILSTVVIWGLPTAATFQWAAHGPLKPSIYRGISLIAGAQAAAAVLLHILILTIFTPDVWDSMWPAAVLSLALGPAFIFREYGLGVIQGARDFRWYNWSRLSHLVLYIPLIALLFLVDLGNLTRIVAVSVLASLAVTGSAMVVAQRWQRNPARPDSKTTLRSMLSFGQQAHFGRLMPVDRFRADQLAVAIFLSPSALGIYAVATAFTNILRFLTMAVGSVAFPNVSNETESDRARRLMWKYVRFAMVLSALIILVLEIVGPPVINLLFGDEFHDAGDILRLLLPGAGFVGVRRVLAESLRGGGHAVATSLAEGATSISFLVLILPLLTLWELSGVALTLTLAEGLGLAVLLTMMLRIERRTASQASGASA
jgi:O-antigen/teichoic acid export membrane protein